MTNKLTLTVERKVIEQAKIYAKDTGRSLSDLIESYLISLINEKHGEEKLSPKLKSLVGSVKLPKNFDSTQTLPLGNISTRVRHGCRRAIT